MPQKFTDGARADLAGSITAGATALAIDASRADLFPTGNTASWSAVANWFKVTIINTVTGAREVVKVGTRTAGSGALGNVLRGQDGTVAQSFTAGQARVFHGPLAADFGNALSGIFSQVTALGVTYGAGFYMAGAVCKMAQTDAAGAVTNDRFSFAMDTGTFTCADFATTSDERLKTAWKNLPKDVAYRLADVRHGTYRLKDRKARLLGGGRMLGVSAQSLREVMPEAVHEDENGMLSVSYGPAALVGVIRVAQENVQLRAALVDLEERVRRLERA